MWLQSVSKYLWVGCSYSHALFCSCEWLLNLKDTDVVRVLAVDLLGLGVGLCHLSCLGTVAYESVHRRITLLLYCIAFRDFFFSVQR